MAENNLQGLMGVSMDKIKEMVDVNTVVGDPIQTPDGTTLIPVSKISYGFAAGGSNLPSKTQAELFGGGSGAGINITPVAFLVVKGDTVKLLPVTPPAGGTVDRVVEMVPEVVDKVTGFIEKQQNRDKEGF